jgi:hypothetical protein
VLQISGSGTFECTFFSSTSGARSGNYGVHVWWASDITVPITTLANNGLMVLYNDNNYFRTTQVGSALRTTIKGETDIPGVLWAGKIAAGGGVASGSPTYNCVGKTVTAATLSDTSLYTLTLSGFSSAPTAVATVELGNSTTSNGWTAQIVPTVSSTQIKIRIRNDNSNAAASFHLILFGKN